MQYNTNPHMQQPHPMPQPYAPQQHQSSSPNKAADLFPIGFPSYQQQATQHVSPPLPNAMAQSLVDLSRSQPHSAHSAATVSPTSGNYTSSSRNQNLNMAEFLDPSEGSSAKAPFYSNAPARRGTYPEPDEEGVSESDDPVSLRALSEVEANSLVQL